jgi:hypothetical protein
MDFMAFEPARRAPLHARLVAQCNGVVGVSKAYSLSEQNRGLSHFPPKKKKKKKKLLYVPCCTLR